MERRIETERLILRTVTVDDAEAIFKWASDPDVNKFMIYPRHPNADVTREWLKTRDIDGEDEFDLGFVLKETGELVGQGGLFYHEDLDAWTVGYNLRKDCWGRGLVPEAIGAIIDCVDRERGVRAIVGEFAKDNAKSRRVMEKLGMTYWKDGRYSKTDGSVSFDSCKYIKEFKPRTDSEFKYECSSTDKERFSLHDCRATSAELNCGKLIFRFPDGIYCMDCPGDRPNTGKAEVEFATDPLRGVTLELFTESEGQTVRKQYTIEQLVEKINNKEWELEFLYRYDGYQEVLFRCWIWELSGNGSYESELWIGTKESAFFRWDPADMFRNFLFDLDQTLLDFHASEKIGLEKVLRKNGLSFSDDVYAAFKTYNKSLWKELEKGTISREELFRKRFSYIFGQCEGDPSGLDPLAVNDDFIRTMSQNGVLMDGALELVKRIKEEIPDSGIYVITNGATINAKGRTASTGLDRFVDDIFISEDMGVTKPSVEFFEMVLEKIGQPRESCLVIGDSLSSDMLGAKNASMDSVWFMPEGDIESAVKEYDIKYTAGSFEELFEVLKDWSPKSMR